MSQLQQPEFVFMNGKLVLWDEALIHVGCEAVTRGLSVFEGLKGYWNDDGFFGILFMERHYKRLLRSAKLLHIPCPWSYQEYRQAVFELMGVLLKKEKDMWIRTTLFAVEGHWGEGTKADLIMTAYHQNKEEPAPINLGISTWQRAGDNMLPARIKNTSNYQMGRLARIEGRSRNYHDMILVNQWGRIAEATGSCVLMVRDGIIYTPPASEGALESITVDFIEKIAKSLNIEFVRRPIDRTELLIAEEIAICGTLAELVPVQIIDSIPIEPYGPVLTTIRDKFFKLVRGKEKTSFFEVEFIPKNQIKTL